MAKNKKLKINNFEPKHHLIGVDIGGTGIKAAVVNLNKGHFKGERVRLDTPHPGTPDAISDTVAKLVQELIEKNPGLKGAPVGIDYPGVIKEGVVKTATNMDKSWINTDAHDVFSKKLNNKNVVVINDADAAGYGEARYGTPKAHEEYAMMITLGTGIGSAIIDKGTLIPNTELGHLKMGDSTAEGIAAESVRVKENLTWQQYAARLQEYFSYLEALFTPDQFLIGGGVSKESSEFLPLLKLNTPISAAKLENKAGIVGSALFAADTYNVKFKAPKA